MAAAQKAVTKSAAAVAAAEENENEAAIEEAEDALAAAEVTLSTLESAIMNKRTLTRTAKIQVSSKIPLQRIPSPKSPSSRAPSPKALLSRTSLSSASSSREPSSNTETNTRKKFKNFNFDKQLLKKILKFILFLLLVEMKKKEK